MLSKSEVTAPNLPENHPIKKYIEAGEPGQEYWNDHDSIDRSVLER